MRKYLLPTAVIAVVAIQCWLAFAVSALADDIRSQFPDVGGGVNGANRHNFNPNHFSPDNYNPNIFTQGSINQSQYAPADDAANQALLKRINFDPRKMTRPDKFADNPSWDGSGGRHFGNGRHYNLASTSVKTAVSQLNASDEQLHEQAIQRQQINQNRGRFPF